LLVIPGRVIIAKSSANLLLLLVTVCMEKLYQLQVFKKDSLLNCD